MVGVPYVFCLLTFYQLYGLPLILLMVSLAVQKLFRLMRSHLSVFPLGSVLSALVHPKKHCHGQCQEALCVFSARNFLVSSKSISRYVPNRNEGTKRQRGVFAVTLAPITQSKCLSAGALIHES